MDKSSLRRLVIDKLKQISPEEKAEIERQLHNHLFASNEWKKATILAVTISRGIEWDTDQIIKQAWKEGKTVVIPKCKPKSKELIFYKYKEGDQLEQTYYQLWEPIPDRATAVLKNNIDLIVVPGVVFDKNGYRIGFGGGYYDRYLVDYTKDTVALLHTKQLANQIPKEYFDIPVKQLITEKGKINPFLSSHA
ncbi:MAG TPA: 5-formyltetrahydrofolate cyclo-ligase [Cerasibacillus sp.]|uniref:5-formyltetrahydrofolate cyclo-ligase n=1 Tax=Cerasibacillus sp. TaxID=2498711 RepID=UPI002F3ECA88